MKAGAVERGSPRFWFILVLVIIAVALGLFLHFERNRSKDEVSKPTERSRNNLVLQDGLLFDNGAPFSGIVFDTYDGGETKSRSMVSNGFLQGLSEGWDTNGVLQVTEYFVRSVSHGVRTKYHPNGKKLSVANIANGQIQGVYQRWHENGTLAEQVNLTNGVPEGESLAFHPDGSLKARVRLVHGEVMEQQFWEPGERRSD